MHTELAPFLYFSLKDNIVCCRTVQISWETKEWYNPGTLHKCASAGTGRCRVGSTDMDGSDKSNVAAKLTLPGSSNMTTLLHQVFLWDKKVPPFADISCYQMNVCQHRLNTSCWTEARQIFAGEHNFWTACYLTLDWSFLFLVFLYLYLLSSFKLPFWLQDCNTISNFSAKGC